MSVLHVVFIAFRAFMIGQMALAAENLALRQQLAILEQKAKRPRLRQRDRIFWVWLSRLWKGWRSVLVIVQPDTVVRWHRQGFLFYWRWKSRTARIGRPRIDAEIRDLIRQMSRENPTWGAPRIQSELHGSAQSELGMLVDDDLASAEIDCLADLVDTVPQHNDR